MTVRLDHKISLVGAGLLLLLLTTTLTAWPRASPPPCEPHVIELLLDARAGISVDPSGALVGPEPVRGSLQHVFDSFHVSGLRDVTKFGGEPLRPGGPKFSNLEVTLPAGQDIEAFKRQLNVVPNVRDVTDTCNISLP